MVDNEKVNKIRNSIIENGFNGAVSIIHNSETILSEGFGMANFEHDVPITTKTRFRIASITKQFTATAILQLVMKGLIKLTDTIDQFIPHYPNGEKITIHHILTHTSGISNFDLGMDFYDVLHAESVEEALINAFKNLPLQFEPGSQFSYSISGFLVLGHIIEEVSGLKYEDYIRTNIFGPLHMDNSGFDHWQTIIKNRADSYNIKDKTLVHADHIDMRIAGAGGGLYSTIEDLKTFNLALKSGKLIDHKTVDIMFDNQFEIAEGVSSGYGIFLQNTEYLGKRRLKQYHTGGGPGVRSINVYYPDDHLIVTAITNINDRNTFDAVINKIDSILFS